MALRNILLYCDEYCVEIKLYCPNNNITEDDSNMYDYMKVFDKPFWV